MPRSLAGGSVLLAKRLAKWIERLSGVATPLFIVMIVGEASFGLPSKDPKRQFNILRLVSPLGSEPDALAVPCGQRPAQQRRQAKGKGDRAENVKDAPHSSILHLCAHFLRSPRLGIHAIFLRSSTSSSSKYGLRSRSGGSDEKFFSTLSICSCMKAL